MRMQFVEHTINLVVKLFMNLRSFYTLFEDPLPFYTFGAHLWQTCCFPLCKSGGNKVEWGGGG